LNKLFSGRIVRFKPLDIDGDDDGLLDAADIRCFLENNGVTVSDGQLNLLVERFDHNQDGLISYADLLNEIFPRSKQQL
jgi:Ca2+-binding EF-hand superfamily protein